jgi:superfamily I DNA/RNA helicase
MGLPQCHRVLKLMQRFTIGCLGVVMPMVELTQEKNNLYVAFTRSKRWLYVTWPENRTMPWGDSKRRKISRFLVNFSCDEIKDDT